MFGPELAYLNSVRHDLQPRAVRDLDAYRQLEDAALNLAPARLTPRASVRTPSRVSANGARLSWRARVAELFRFSREAHASAPHRPGSVYRGEPSDDVHRGLGPATSPAEFGTGPRQPSKY